MYNQAVKIELLYFDGCPSWSNAHDSLVESLEKLEISAEIALIAVETEQGAIEHKFTGSPTLKVDGADLFPTGQTDFSLGCRVYQTPQGLKGWPTKEMIIEKLTSIEVGD